MAIGGNMVDLVCCPLCGGKGTVNMEKRRWSYLSQREYEKVECPECEGRGTVKVCSFCGHRVS